MHRNQFHSQGSHLISIIVWVFAVKMVIFLIDPTVMFFMRDSSRYIDTALVGYIPPDRSFLYGFVIRGITFFWHSLTSLVFLQILCNATSAVIAGYLLNRFLSVSWTGARIFAVLCAIAPIQLLYERYVLTETISLLFFALFVLAAFFYLENAKIRTLVVLNLLGVLLIAFRLSYLPIVLIGAVIAPVLALFHDAGRQVKCSLKDKRAQRVLSRKAVMTACLHILVSCLLIYGLHSAYKIINGRLSDKPPVYQYYAGFHLISSWAPLLENEDFADPYIGAYLMESVPFDLKDRFQRNNQRWHFYGLANCIRVAYGDALQSDKVAYDTALNILFRNPFGVIKLAWQSYLDYWNIGHLKRTLLGDRYIRQFPKKFLETLKLHYNLDGEKLPSQKTLTNQFFLNAIPWYMILFCLPLIIAISIIMDRGHHLEFLVLLGLFSCLVLVNSTALIHRNTLRFYHPNEWMEFVFLGVLLDRTVKMPFIQEIGNRFRSLSKKAKTP
jgi:hypothetical protein